MGDPSTQEIREQRLLLTHTLEAVLTQRVLPSAQEQEKVRSAQPRGVTKLPSRMFAKVIQRATWYAALLSPFLIRPAVHGGMARLVEALLILGAGSLAVGILMAAPDGAWAIGALSTRGWVIATTATWGIQLALVTALLPILVSSPAGYNGVSVAIAAAAGFTLGAPLGHRMARVHQRMNPEIMKMVLFPDREASVTALLRRSLEPLRSPHNAPPDPNETSEERQRREAESAQRKKQLRRARWHTAYSVLDPILELFSPISLWFLDPEAAGRLREIRKIPRRSLPFLILLIGLSFASVGLLILALRLSR